MTQIGKSRQRAQIVAVGVGQFQILKVRAVCQGRDVADVAHGKDRDFQLRHLGSEADVREIGVVAQVQVLHIVAVIQPFHIAVIQHAAAGGHGGEDALGIGAGGIVVAEEDAEHHLRVGVVEVDLLQALRLQAAAVHVHISELRHIAHDLVHEPAVIRDGCAVEIDGGIGQIAVHAVELEGVFEHRCRQDLAQAADVAPSECAALGAEVNGLQPRQQGKLVRCGLTVGT